MWHQVQLMPLVMKFGSNYQGHCIISTVLAVLLADLKNQPKGSSCITHILPFCGYFKGQEQTVFYPTS